MVLTTNKQWDIYEASLLLEAIINVEEGKEKKNEAIVRVSNLLRDGAYSLGYEIEEKYRNIAGITLQWRSLEYEYRPVDYTTDKPHSSKTFYEIIRVYKYDPKRYDLILSKAKARYCVSSVQEGFLSWFQDQGYNLDPNVIIQLFTKMEEWGFHRSIITHRLFWNKSESELIQLLFSISKSPTFRRKSNGDNTKLQSLMRLYIRFVQLQNKELIEKERSLIERNRSTGDLGGETKPFAKWLIDVYDNSLNCNISDLVTALEDVASFADNNNIGLKPILETDDYEQVKKVGTSVLQNVRFRTSQEGKLEIVYKAFEYYLQYIKQFPSFLADGYGVVTQKKDLCVTNDDEYLEKNIEEKNALLNEDGVGSNSEENKAKKHFLLSEKEVGSNNEENKVEQLDIYGMKNAPFIWWLADNCPKGYAFYDLFLALGKLSLYSVSHSISSNPIFDIHPISEVYRITKAVLQSSMFRKEYQEDLELVYDCLFNNNTAL